MATAVNRDVLFLIGHGYDAGAAGISSDAVGAHFDPGSTRPLVFSTACESGRYPTSPKGIAETFLAKGAAAYIGATEVTRYWGWNGRGWNYRLAEAFFGHMGQDRTLGRTLTLTKQARLSAGDANSRDSDWNRNRYHCAVYHFYGDPKLEMEWEDAREAAPQILAQDPAQAQPVGGPLSQVPMVIPIAELRRDFSTLAAGSRFNCEAVYTNASLTPRDCQVIVYAQFGGQTTALMVGADWHDAPLRWDSAVLTDGQVQLRWPSVAGRTYTIEFTPVLGTPFTTLLSNLPATPPQNTVTLTVAPDSSGFFRLRED